MTTTLLISQNYVNDEFIIEYVESATETERQAVKAYFNINVYSPLGENLEHWKNIQFPIVINDEGTTTTINNPEELLSNIQEGDDDNDQNSPRSNINNGDLNYLLQLDDNSIIYENGTFDPLPFCENDVNDLLIGPDIKHEPKVPLNIIIVDQRITSSDDVIDVSYLFVDSWDSPSPTGTHGNKVHSVINNQLEQVGITDVTYYNLVVFDDNGVGTYSRILGAFAYLSEIGSELGYTDFLRNSIMNFSANMIIHESETDLILWDHWNNFITAHNILLITSAGNQGIIDDNIFPAANNWDNEISVAGAESCLKYPWASSNGNPDIFDIATEAEDILVNDGNGYRLVNGTSYSSAFVTGAAAQLAARCDDFNPVSIKNQLLISAFENNNLLGLVNQGRILDVTAAVNSWNSVCGSSGGNEPLQSYHTTSPLALTPTPNPFTESSLITIELPQAGDLTITLHNSIGQRVHQEFIPNQQEMQELEWPTPQHLAPGTYILRVQAGESVAQTMLIKQ